MIIALRGAFVNISKAVLQAAGDEKMPFHIVSGTVSRYKYYTAPRFSFQDAPPVPDIDLYVFCDIINLGVLRIKNPGSSILFQGRGV